MRNIIQLTGILILIAMCSCKKDTTTSECFSNVQTVRQITNVAATIKESNGNYFIVEQASIDTKLNPCKLESQYQINNLQVIISGDVKLTARDYGPCCTDNFVITKISK